MYSVRPVNKKFTSRLIDFKQFLADNKCQELFGNVPYYERTDEPNIELMNTLKADFREGELTEDYFISLAEFCNPGQLFSNGDIPTASTNAINTGSSSHFTERFFYKPIPITEDALRLNMVAKLKQRIIDDPNYDYKFYVKNRTTGVNIKTDFCI